MKKTVAMLICAALIISAFSGCGMETADIEDASVESVGIDGADNDASQIEQTDEPDAQGNLKQPAQIPLNSAPTEAEQAANDTDVQKNALSGRGYYTDTAGAESATVMLYLCGSDLESCYGCASADLSELIDGFVSENVNVVVETGGADYWYDYDIGRENQRWLLDDEGLTILDGSLGERDMTKAETLTDFIRFGAENYPADRYILILWDHGGGTVGGYGYDERFPESESMQLDALDTALNDGGVKFDVVGFDACLMATLEVAFVLETYADYMMASQMEEPGEGWSYSSWISKLSNNVSIHTPELSGIAIDDFITESQQADAYTQATLSLVDLTKLPAVFEALNSFFESAGEELKNNGFAEVSRARSDMTGLGVTRAMTQDCEQVDIIGFAGELSAYEGSAELISAVEDAVIYESETAYTEDRNGLNFYFPYNDLSMFNEAVELLGDIGYSQSYIDYLSSFVSVMAGGQSYQGGALESGADDYGIDSLEDYFFSDWFDTELFDSYADTYYDDYSYTDELEVWDKNGQWVLTLSDEDWELITQIELQLLYDDGEGYIEMGYDNVYEFDEDGDLVITFDNSWVSLAGQNVCFYYESEQEFDDGSWTTSGYVPAYINGEYAEIIVTWDSENPEGYVEGYRRLYDSFVSQKGLFQLEIGDKIEYVCDYYDYDMYYDDEYNFGDAYCYDGDMYVSYEDIGYGECLVYYCLTDIYGSYYWTEPVVFYD